MMKRATLFTCILGLFVAAPVSGAPEDMNVSTWDDGTCHHTMTTNHFELAPGESVEFDLILTGCSPQELGDLLYFGYRTTKNSSRLLTNRDKIQLTMLDDSSNQLLLSNSGSIFAGLEAPTTCRVTAKNMNARKTIKIRLRSSVLHAE